MKLADARVLRDTLGLVDRPVPLKVIMHAWSDLQCNRAERWACLEHLHASDNPVERIEEPKHVRVWRPKP